MKTEKPWKPWISDDVKFPNMIQGSYISQPKIPSEVLTAEQRGIKSRFAMVREYMFEERDKKLSVFKELGD